MPEAAEGESLTLTLILTCDCPGHGATPAQLCHGPRAAARLPQGAWVSLSPSCSLFPSADVGPRQKPASSSHGETPMGSEVGTAMGCCGAEEAPPGDGDEDEGEDGKVTPQAPPKPSQGVGGGCRGSRG